MPFSFHPDEMEVDEDLLYGSRDGEPMPKPNVTAKKPVQSVGIPLGARGTDPVTSHDAVPDISTSAGVQAVILAAAKLHGPGTEEEFSEWCNIPRPSISPQFRPMIRAGLLVDVTGPDGKKLKRKNRSGKLALVRGLPPAKATAPDAPSLEDMDDLY